MAHDPLKPLPENPKTDSDLRALQHKLQENEVCCRELIRHSKWVIDNHAKRMEEADDAIRRAVAKKQELERQFEQAPIVIADAEAAILRIQRKVHRILVQPKLDKIEKLKRQVAELEKQQAPGGVK